MFVPFLIFAVGILVAGPLHHGGIAAIKAEGFKKATVKALTHGQKVPHDHTGNFGND